MILLKKSAFYFLVVTLAFVCFACGSPMGSVPGPGWEPEDWTVVENTNFEGGRFFDVCYGNGRFIAGGGNGGKATTVRLVYSDDNGATWKAVTGYSGSAPITNLAWGGGGIFVAGTSNTEQISYSTDNGMTWTREASLADTGYVNAITWGNNKFVASTDKGTIMASPDGKNWKEEPSGSIFTPTSVASEIAFGNGIFVAVGQNGKMMYSNNNTGWARVTPSPLTQFIPCVAYGNGRFVAVNVLGDSAYSTDGKNWTKATGVLPKSSTGIAYGNSRFIVSSDLTPRKLMSSADGITWTEKASIILGNSSGVTCIAFGNGVFVAAGWNGKIAICK